MGPSSHSFVDHTGELAVHLEAESTPELFVEAARALGEVMLGRAARGTGAYERVSVTAPDREALLVAWIDELVFRAERDKKIYLDARIERLTGTELEGVVRGRPTARLKTHVKAATYHDLAIVERPEGVSATVILDV